MDDEPHENERKDHIVESRGRNYLYAGAAAAAVIGGVVAVGIAGVMGVGLALTLAEATLLVLGGTLAVVTIAVLGTLFSMRHTLNTVWERQAHADASHMSRTRATGEEGRTGRARRGEGLPQATPFGNIYRVRDVEGIGEAFGVRLEELNIVDTEQLWEADQGVIARELDVSRTTVGRWQDMAELMALEPVEPEHAELLVIGGITSIDDLADSEPDEVAHSVQQADKDREVRIQGHPISEKHTDPWVYAARKHDPVSSRVSR